MFREVKEVPRKEVNPMEKEPEKIEFKLEGEKYDSMEEVESKEDEPHTPVLRRSSQEIRKLERYSPPDFCTHFAMSITDDDPKNVNEIVNSEDSDLWKKAMDEEMYSLDKNEAWNIVNYQLGEKSLGENGYLKRS